MKEREQENAGCEIEIEIEAVPDDDKLGTKMSVRARSRGRK